MQPTMTTLLVQSASPDQRAGVFIATSNFAVIIPILGPTIGGLILNAVHWRWVFFINVPLCIAAFVLALRCIRDPGRRSAVRFDFLGLVLLSPSLALILLGLTPGSSHGFNAALWTGLALLALFVVRTWRTRVEPILDLRLFRSRTFLVSGVLRFLSGFALFGATFLIPLFCQQVRGMSALSSGLLLSLQGVGFVLVRWIGKPLDRLGPKRSVIVGLILVGAGTLAFTQSGSLAWAGLLGLSLVLRGGGLSMVNVAISVIAYDGLSHDDIPQASGAIRLLQQLGGAFGVAVLAYVLQACLKLGDAAAAFDVAFWWSIGFIAIALVFSAFLPGPGRQTKPQEE
jgi:EmrB/QacA subfamily drug resistance transporter